jgi:hypothetical protein
LGRVPDRESATHPVRNMFVARVYQAGGFGVLFSLG